MKTSSGQPERSPRVSGSMERPCISGGTGSPAASSSVGGLVVALVRVVRLDEGVEEIEGSVVMRVDVADGGIGERVHAVAGEPHRLVLMVVDHRAVGVGGELERVRGEPIAVAAALPL